MVRYRMIRTVGSLLNSDFADTDSIAAATRKSLEREHYGDFQSTDFSFSSTVLGEGAVRVSCRSSFHNLQARNTFVQKFYFVGREELREMVRIVEPKEPEMCTDVIVGFAPGEHSDYFNVSVHESTGKLIAADAVVFDRLGHVRSFPFTSDMVSPLSVRTVELTECLDTNGMPVIRFTVGFDSLENETEVAMHWEALGIDIIHQCFVGPSQRLASADMLLAENPSAFPGDWVAIAVDGSGRFIAQTFFTLSVCGS